MQLIFFRQACSTSAAAAAVRGMWPSIKFPHVGVLGLDKIAPVRAFGDTQCHRCHHISRYYRPVLAIVTFVGHLVWSRLPLGGGGSRQIALPHPPPRWTIRKTPVPVGAGFGVFSKRNRDFYIESRQRRFSFVTQIRIRDRDLCICNK